MQNEIRQLQLSGRLGMFGQRGTIVGASTWGDLYYLGRSSAPWSSTICTPSAARTGTPGGALILVARQQPNGSRLSPPGDPRHLLRFALSQARTICKDLTVRLADLAISKDVGERTGDVARSRGDDPYERRPNLERSQRELAGHLRRGRGDER